MPERNRVAYAAVVISAVAVGLSGWTTARSRSVAATPSCGEHAALVEKIDSLQRQLARIAVAGSADTSGPQGLAQRVARLESAVDGLGPDARSADGGDSDAGEARDDRSPSGEPRYLSIVSPNPAVKVRQDPDGSFAASNTDPTLVGKTLFVEAKRADGTIDKLPIFVPPPK